MKTALIITGIVLIAVISFVWFSYRRIKNAPEVEKSEKIVDLTDKNFRFQTKNDLVLIDFWASWCMPCRMMAPVLNEIAEDSSLKVKVFKVNVEQYQNLAVEHGIRGIPTMILMKNGKEIERIVGVKSKDYISDRIKKAM